MSREAFAYVKRLKRCPDGSELLMSERVAAMVLGDFYHDDGAFPSVARLADECGVDLRRCRRLLDALQDKKLITKTRPDSQGRAHLTCFKFPEFDAMTPEQKKSLLEWRKEGTVYPPYEEIKEGTSYPLSKKKGG